MRVALAAAFCALLAACTGTSILESITTPEDRAYAVAIIRALQIGDAAVVTRDMPQDFVASATRELPKMREALPQGEASVPRLVDASVELLSASRRMRLIYAVDDHKRHALVTLFVVRMKDGVVFLQGLHVSPLTQPIEDLSPSFDLSGKSWGQYLFLVFALLSAATCAAALYLLYRATDVPRKWPWAIVCALGIGEITMNWGSGQLSGHMWAVELFGVMATRPGLLAPWYITLGLPIGAYAFLLRQAHAYAAKREIRIQKS